MIKFLYGSLFIIFLFSTNICFAKPIYGTVQYNVVNRTVCPFKFYLRNFSCQAPSSTLIVAPGQSLILTCSNTQNATLLYNPDNAFIPKTYVFFLGSIAPNSTYFIQNMYFSDTGSDKLLVQFVDGLGQGFNLNSVSNPITDLNSYGNDLIESDYYNVYISNDGPSSPCTFRVP